MVGLNRHQEVIHEVANRVDQLILDRTARVRFTDYIDRFCKMVEDYGQTLQHAARKLEKECPLPKAWLKTLIIGTDFLKVPKILNQMNSIYLPNKAVNPFLWFRPFEISDVQRQPTDSEKMMSEYVVLAAIHDCELCEATDRHICSANYKGKWFKQDKFFCALWQHYRWIEDEPHLGYPASPDDERLRQKDYIRERRWDQLISRATEKELDSYEKHSREKLTYLERVFQHVKADLPAKEPAEAEREATPGRWQRFVSCAKKVVEKGWQIFTKSFWEAVLDKMLPK